MTEPLPSAVQVLSLGGGTQGWLTHAPSSRGARTLVRETEQKIGPSRRARDEHCVVGAKPEGSPSAEHTTCGPGPRGTESLRRPLPCCLLRVLTSPQLHQVWG